jgi:hypothetical protein
VVQGREHDVAMGSQGAGCGAGSLALGVLSRLLTCLHLLYEVPGAFVPLCALAGGMAPAHTGPQFRV